MSIKIRLQRHGRSKKPFYNIIVTNTNSPRDGKFIEKLGFYDPNYNPSIINVNIENTLNWINKGALTTNTAKNILSKKGVFLKKHLLNGVKKGAFDIDEANKRFNNWIGNKKNNKS